MKSGPRPGGRLSGDDGDPVACDVVTPAAAIGRRRPDCKPRVTQGMSAWARPMSRASYPRAMRASARPPVSEEMVVAGPIRGHRTVRDRFQHLADHVTRAVGSPTALLLAAAAIVVWALSG